MIEITCETYEDVVSAIRAGATHVAVASAQFSLKGLSASASLVELIKKNHDVSVNAMVRPRPGGFDYSDHEYEQMRAELTGLICADVDKVTFGFLNHDGTVNAQRTQEFVRLAKEGGVTPVFSQAIDCCQDIRDGIELLHEMGVEEVITAAGHDDISEATSDLASFQQEFAGRISIVAAPGLIDTDVERFLSASGIQCIQAAGMCPHFDATSKGDQLDFGLSGDEDVTRYQAVSTWRAAKLIKNASAFIEK